MRFFYMKESLNILEFFPAIFYNLILPIGAVYAFAFPPKCVIVALYHFYAAAKNLHFIKKNIVFFGL